MSLNLDCFASVYFRTHIVKLFLFFKGMCQGDDEVLSMETVVINVNLKVISVFVCLYYKSCKIPICTAENSSIKNDAMSLCVQ